MTKHALSVRDFCESHSISRAHLYNLWAAGEGPRFFNAGRRRLITPEAAAEWRRDGEVKASRTSTPEAA